MTVIRVDAPDTPEWHKARQVIVANRNGVNNILSGYFGDVDDIDGDYVETDEDMEIEEVLTKGDIKRIKAMLVEIYETSHEIPRKSHLGPLFPEEASEVVIPVESLTGNNTSYSAEE